MAHAIIQPGAPGWLDAIDRDIALRPDAFKGYTIGDNTHKDLAKPWRLDDEALVYSFYEKAVKAGLTNICIHKGLFSKALEMRYPHLRRYADVSDVRSEEHTSELQSLMRISDAVFCLKQNNILSYQIQTTQLIICTT